MLWEYQRLAYWSESLLEPKKRVIYLLWEMWEIPILRNNDHLHCGLAGGNHLANGCLTNLPSQSVCFGQPILTQYILSAPRQSAWSLPPLILSSTSSWSWSLASQIFRCPEWNSVLQGDVLKCLKVIPIHNSHHHNPDHNDKGIIRIILITIRMTKARQGLLLLCLLTFFLPRHCIALE